MAASKILAQSQLSSLTFPPRISTISTTLENPARIPEYLAAATFQLPNIGPCTNPRISITNEKARSKLRHHAAAVGKSLSPDATKNTLSHQVVLEYYDETKLRNMHFKRPLLPTTLYQQCGKVQHHQGFLKMKAGGRETMSRRWGIPLENITFTAKDGKVSQLEHVFIRGSRVGFMVIPDMLKNAPMFKRLDVKIKGKSSSLGVGRI
ncbi:Small nuclear ribonucleoprotein Sm D3 [Hibiscus syriacus]|uniref:Small nuclear ribonucleoprotein Sm D3 n=1 Tax=Hibiscus syriacus TaxID=106335 RepID=A0A6A3C021_HIBSY|nr:Small nuclear ribonucleoprotein Sm D3 [Hibiscus syriacus]